MKIVLGLVLLVQSSMAISFSNSTDESALFAFKSAIKHDPNNVLASNWTKRTNFCYWIGVECNPHRLTHRVAALPLANMSLGGTLSPHLGNLSFLKELDLSNNSFYGFLTPELSRLHNIVSLILFRNHLQGEIPTSIQNCRKLQFFSLSRNGFSGKVPVELTTLPLLRVIYLGNNNLSGTIPPSIGNMSSLEFFGLARNNIHGNIRDEMVHLLNLKGINFEENYLTGSIPPALFNMSSLEQVLLGDNQLSGQLPLSTGLWLPNLEKLAVDSNHLIGDIPLNLSSSYVLNELGLWRNEFTGQIPRNLGQLKFLEQFNVASNQLTIEPGSSELDFLTAMTNCSSLEALIIEDNPFGGTLPDSIANLSSSVQRFYAGTCQIKGQIPKGIGSLNVNLLALSYNNLHGTIPSTVGGMRALQTLYISNNKLEGSIPDEICLLSNLGEIYLFNNKLSGPIPHCIGNLSYQLQWLLLNSNMLNSSLPSSLWSLENLVIMDLSSNSLVGGLDSNIGALKTLNGMDLSLNQISGKIPSNIGAFQSLTYLNLLGNSFWGPIPESLGNLITLDYLDLSHNNLSETIPKTLEALSHLKYLNLSFNKLSGEIPSSGPFKNLTGQSFLGNEALCGQQNFQVPPCTKHIVRKKKYLWRKIVLGCSLFIIALLVTFITVFFILKRHRQNSVPSQNPVGLLPRLDHKMLSYLELLRATNNFCETNLLGAGSFGSVYKGILSDGTIVAVKFLNLLLEGAFKSFDAECKVLRTVRHRNLVKIISTCSNQDLRALVLEYMSNGSLEKWLYSYNYCLDLLQRVSIMIDVAMALDYLHHGQTEPVIHCDLKPSNVLLNEDMVAHVADFGISKILAENNSTTHTKTLGSLGYIAPEYGSEGKVSIEGDIYSYGIMLLETFTRRKPTDEMFTGELSLKQWVNASLPNKVLKVVDNGLLNNGMDMAVTHGCLLDILELGVECCAELPDERSDIKDVVYKLNHIKLKLHQNKCA